MSLKVVILDSAQADLKELRGYLVKNFGAETWQGSFQKLKDAIRNIGSFPELGHVPEELQTLEIGRYRQVLAGMNRVIYEVREDTAYIHIICDTRRDLRGLLTRRLLRAV